VDRGQPGQLLQADVQGEPSVERSLDDFFDQGDEVDVPARAGGHEAEGIRQLADDVARVPGLLQHLLALVRHDHGGGPRPARHLLQLVFQLAHRGRHQRGEGGQAARALRFLGDHAGFAAGTTVHVGLPVQAHGGGGGEEESAGGGDRRSREVRRRAHVP
jgi:hypothetical protein